MSTTINDTRQQLVDERLAELEELSDRRNDLLREMFRLVRYGESGSSSVLLEEEEVDDEELEQFLERFDLRKNTETGSILTLEVPELMLEAGRSRETTPSEPPPEMEELKHTDVGDEELQYPTSSPLIPRTNGRQTSERKEAGAEDVAMDVDETPAAQEQEETPLDDEQEKEDEEEEPQMPPRKRARTSSPIAPRRRGRRRSDVLDEDEAMEDKENPPEPPEEMRKTRSKSRKMTTPSPVDDEEEDELDIISRRSSISPSRRHPSKQHLSPQTSSVEAEPVHEDTDTDEVDEAQAEEGPEESAHTAREKLEEGTKVVPASPSTLSARSPTKSLSLPPVSRGSRESPIRAPKQIMPQFVDNTPLTPPRSPPPPVLIRLPVHQPERPVFRFAEESARPAPGEVEIKTENEATASTSALDRPPARPRLEKEAAKKPSFNYTLPPLSALPAEFNRKGKPQKRKRDRERERSGSDMGRKDDWVPLGMAKWSALLIANPAYKKLSRATKCVNTKDWNTAATELKLIRILDRLDVLKRTGKWSFRQPKKQRVAASLIKTHWDYLMDEMKWMQVDFKEEKRWKVALAYELALSVLEWHEAGSYEERIRLGICARWRRPDPLEIPAIDDVQPMEVDTALDSLLDGEGRDSPRPDDMQANEDLDAAASDNEEDEVEDQCAVTAALIPDTSIAEALDEAPQAVSIPDEAEGPSMTMKLEDLENTDALRLAEAANSVHNSRDPNQMPQVTSDQWQERPKTEVVDPSQALKGSSDNPILDFQPSGSTSAPDSTQKDVKSLWTPEQTKTLRVSLLSLPEESLVVSLDQFVPLTDEELMESLAPEGDSAETSTSIGLTALFPELQPFSMIDVPNSEIVGNNSDGKRKSDKKADRDDPTKRVDETTYTKLCPTNRFMHIKPTLVSALQPAKKWRKGKWLDLDESPVVSDVDSPPSMPSAENSCSLFEGRKITIPFQPPLMLHNFSKMPHNTVKKQEIPWSLAEDNMLKSLAERYPSNWRLVADALNSSRIRTSIDLRTPQECFERWRAKCGIQIRQALLPNAQQSTAPYTNNEEPALPNPLAGVDTPPPPPPSTSSAPVTASQMTTRGIKRLATSAAQNAANLTINTSVPTVEARKRKRHLIIHEAVRKTLARRQKLRKQDELKYQASSTVAPVHDTHHQFGNKPRYTPLELSQMKAERERKEFDLQLMRRRELEAKRQQQQQQQQQLHAQLQQVQQQQQQQQQQQMGQQGVNISQNVPQIRAQQVGISQHQQQRQSTQVGSVPVSPQLMQAQAAQRALAQAQAQAQAQQVQSQGQQAQPQTGLSQLQGQMTGGQTSINGNVPHLSAPFVNHGGASSPVAQHSSPPRSTATPVNSTANFPRPASAQRNVAMPGGQVLPIASSSVPIARTNNALAAYMANSGSVQYTPEQISHLMRLQQQQQMQMQMQQQQQQQPMQMQMQQGQQNAHQGGLPGYPPTG